MYFKLVPAGDEAVSQHLAHSLLKLVGGLQFADSPSLINFVIASNCLVIVGIGHQRLVVLVLWRLGVSEDGIGNVVERGSFVIEFGVDIELSFLAHLGVILLLFYLLQVISFKF